MNNGTHRSIAKGLVSGLIGGAVASWVMTEFQTAAMKLKPPQSGGQSSEDEPATVKLADRLSTRLLHRPLKEERKQVAGSAVHYAFGTSVGGLYGVLAEQWDGVQRAEGTLFGSVLWLAADEVAVPAAGLSRKPWEYPASTNAYALGSHLVYGLTLETVRRVLRGGYLSR